MALKEEGLLAVQASLMQWELQQSTGKAFPIEASTLVCGKAMVGPALV